MMTVYVKSAPGPLSHGTWAHHFGLSMLSSGRFCELHLQLHITSLKGSLRYVSLMLFTFESAINTI